MFQAALEALLRAWPSDKEWRAALPALAADVSKLGPSHRSAAQAPCQHCWPSFPIDASPCSRHLNLTCSGTCTLAQQQHMRGTVLTGSLGVTSCWMCRAHLAVLHALPAHAPRGAQLRAAAATLLLHRLVPPLFKVSFAFSHPLYCILHL